MIQENKFHQALNKYSKVDHCILCGKTKSICYSHIVPQFILHEIAEDGRVAYGYSLSSIRFPESQKVTGVSNAHPFRLICRECDGKWFKEYENPSNILEFNGLDSNLQKNILCEMGLKAHLAHISLKYRNLVARDMASGGELGKLEKEGKVRFGERIDIDEHKFYCEELIKTKKTNDNPFIVLYNRVLDYKTKISTQTIINFDYDLNGLQIFDPNYVSEENVGRYFYLMIIPYKNQTRVLFYIDKGNAQFVTGLINQFNSLTDEEKLQFLFISLIAYDEQFFMSPSFVRNVLKKDKKIIKLYTKTEKKDCYKAKIKDFRKYKNYLLKEYNSEQLE